MILNYEIFYRRFGLRRVDELLTPRFGALQSFQLPAGAIYHHAHGDVTRYGPVESDLAFRGVVSEVVGGKERLKSIVRPIWMQHAIELIQPEGNPTKQGTAANIVLNQFHQQHKRFKRPTKIEVALNDVASLMVYNYDALPHLYRYPRTSFNQYFEWRNIERLMWKNIARVAQETNRPQFIIRSMPKVLPAKSSFVLAEQMTTPRTAITDLFNTPEHLFLIELWKWLGPNRANSMLAEVPRDKLSLINIVFQESGKWVVINLGILNSWRKPLDTEINKGDVIRSNLIDPPKFQDRGLRFWMAVTQLRSVVDPEVEVGEEQSLDEEDAKEAIKEFNKPGSVNVHRVPSSAPVKNAQTGRTELNSTSQNALVMDVPDKPADTPESVVQDPNMDAKVQADLAQMERIGSAKVNPQERVVSPTGVVIPPSPPIVLKRMALDEAVMSVCNRYADEGAMTANQYRHFQKISGAYKNIKAPDGSGNLEQFISIAPESLKITESRAMADIAAVPDKTMLKSSLLEFDERYIEEIMQRDIASAVMAIQNAGVAVTSYEVERVDSILGSYNMYSVRVAPVEGLSSTLRFKLPVVDGDGTYQANGVKYRMRKQRGDVPIRKTAPDTVALTSYYGKMFVRRSEKKVNNYGTWLTNAIMAKNLDEHDTMVTVAHPNKVHDHLFKSARLYSILAKSFRSFTLRPMGLPVEIEHLIFNLSFDHTKREALYGAHVLAQYETDGAIVAGVGGANNEYYFIIHKDNSISVAQGANRYLMPSIEAMLGLDRLKAPVDFAVARISGENIPLGVVLAYEIGLDNLIQLLGANVRRVPAGRRLNLAQHEESIVFNDETLIIDRNDAMACMFLAGFNEYHRSIKRYNVHLFNKRDVYFNVLESANLGVRWLREMDLLYQMFIDPVTRDLLIEMKEPTDMRLLLLRAGEMLVHDEHPAEFDAAFLRIKGYERMAGAVYSEVVRTLRKHNGSPGKHRSQLDMNPYDVWTSIQTDPSKTQVSDINPINNLREKEALTYNGNGGRNSRTMTKHTRAYHPNDMGTVSSDTVDSGDVAINTYLSADPQFTSLRGLSRRYDQGQMGITPLLSSSALLAVGSDHDDPKRVNFVGIQQTHGVSCNGYRQMPTRTGYEQVIAQRTSDMYAVAATEDGKVVSVTPTGVIVEYAGGKQKGFEIGRRYGNAAGLTIPHALVSNVKVGQEFKKGSILTYNQNFFEKDFLNPTNVVWKAGVLATVVLMEVSETLEDSSAISQSLADQLITPITKTVDVIVSFDQNVRKLVKAGDAVNSEDILCIIEDAVTSNAGLFDEESLDTLRLVENQSPQAKVKGVVERIEVFYNGDKDDMSDSLRTIVNATDRELATRLKSINRKPLTGMVDEGFRIDGSPLPLDSMAIRVYITSQVSTGEGDKGVFANQMKTVFGKNFVGDYRTESGTTIDAIFGMKSIDDRIVHSPLMIGTTNVLLELMSRKAYELYKNS